MRYVRAYFLKHPDSLTEVVRLVDETIHDSTKWVNKTVVGELVFHGEDDLGNVYKLDIQEGRIIKNRSSISRLP